MIRWIPYAFVRIVLFFIAGICLGICYPDALSWNYSFSLFLLFVSLYWCAVFIIRKKELLVNHNEVKAGIGFLGLTAIFLAGYLHLLSSSEVRRDNHLVNNKHEIQYYQAVLINTPAEKENSSQVEARIETAFIQNKWTGYSGKVMLYFSRKDFAKPFQYGDVFLIKGNLQLVQPAANPGEFDYKRFLGFKNIFHQQFLNGQDVKLIANDPPNRIIQHALRCRSWAESVFKKYVTDAREQGIIIALVLGVTDGLDNELLSAYAATGTMHVLAVSGLHVGIIYWLLLTVLSPLNRSQAGKWIIAFICIAILWLYAFVTGLSPSVLRAVTMFSFVAVSRPLGCRTNIYNTLALSAFVILIYDPYLIMSVGFQLSYLAVLGIVYLNQGISNLFEPATWALRKVWECVSMSIAAQLATFALGLLYFHQFPNYFIISNILVIPASSFILVMGLVLLAAGSFTLPAIWVGYVIAGSIKVMNEFVFWIESLPFSLINNIYITPWQCSLLIAITVGLILLIKYRQLKYLKMTAAFMFLFSVLQWYHYTAYVNQKKIAVYSVRGHSAIDLMDRGQVYCLTDSFISKDERSVKFHIQPNRLMNQVGKVLNAEDAGIVRRLNGCDLLSWNNKLILLINNKIYQAPPSLPLDYVIIANNAITDLSALQQLDCKQLILDGSNSAYFSARLLEQANEKHIPIHSVLKMGAFIDVL